MKKYTKEEQDKINEMVAKTNAQMTDEELSKMVFELEKEYPHLNRLPDYKLIGFNPVNNVPVWMRTWIDNSKYPPEKLRQLRAERGVGKRKKESK